MRICQTNGAAREAVRPAARLPVRLRYSQQPCNQAPRPRGTLSQVTSYSHQGIQALTFSKLAIQGPSRSVSDQMAGCRVTMRASNAVKAAELAVADIKPDPEAAVLNGTHADRGVKPETDSLAAAVNGVKQPKARKSRAKANGAIKVPMEPTVKLESGESVAAELAASIEVAKKGALLVSEETVRKGRGRKQQPPQPVATSMPAIPAAEAAPKARGRRIKAVAAPMIKSEEDAVAQEQPLTAGAEPPPAAPPKRRAARRVKSATAAVGNVAEAALKAVPISVEVPPAAPPKKKAVRRAKSAKAATGEAAEAAVKAVPIGVEYMLAAQEELLPKKRAPRRKKAAAATDAAAEEGDVEGKDEDKPKPKRQRRAKSAPSELPAVEGTEGNPKADPEADPEAAAEPMKKKRRPKGPDPDAFMLPAREVLEIAQANPPGPRPLPNLGYACLNMDLREQRPPIFTNRACIQKTFLEKGLDYVSELALENCKALAGIIQWNHEKGIRLFRLSSDIFPWCTEYELKQLKDFDAIADELAFAGKLARAYDQRLTFHPSHFVKLAAETDELLNKSIKELEVHSLVFDLMGFQPCHYNKINIHVGGIYGDKEHTIRRFADNFNKRCSPNLQARLTVENDDRPNSYSMTDLLLLHNLTSIPLVFDFHHQKFCPGDFNEKGALYAAVATWPSGIRPVVHWSESQEGRIPHAHSDYISGPMNLHGLEKDIDVMIEAKCKERALLRFREAMVQPPSKDAVMAGKFV